MAAIPQRGLVTQNSRDKTRIQRTGCRIPSPAFPASPIEGDVFWNTTSKDLWVWDGVAWRKITIT